MKLSSVLWMVTVLGSGCAKPPSDASVSQTTSGQSLAVSVEAADTTDPTKMDAALLKPASCTLNGGVATVTGAFAGPAPEGHRRVGAFMVLHVYGPPGPGQAHGVELADVKHEGGSVWNGTLEVYGDGPWTVTAPVNLKAGTPTSCEVGIERVQPASFHGAPG